MLNNNSDVLVLVGQAEAQIRALGYPPRVLAAACRAMLLREDGVECPEFIGYWAPSILASMTTPLTVDECAYAMADLAGKRGVEVLSIDDKELAPLVAAEALSKMEQVVEESGVLA